MSTEEDSPFIHHLQQLQNQDRGAIATLRHSLAFAPGDYPKAYPYVERFVGRDWHALDARRLARYAIAGLFAMHPVRHSHSLAAALGHLFASKQRPSLELRFLALLEADAESVMNHLCQAVSLLATEGRGFDHALLLKDLCTALDERAAPEWRDRLKRQWARDFYRASSAADDSLARTASPSNTTTD
ncbi:CRISPR system Cascade subunit CasB [Paucibacter oligotrophus]|uniref:CRISPR system Cascade subunit CasB n=1 Tax=Roseateles oligotrophus TaxID=1769250 RepID=A0A840L4H8_9BURK|nr:type I-E CRISPR-associated protein Cse2/CasB [Roseateles oligotrophus]MBB4842876.1 CRISPR system Cascade subunit CasB [Roseateles oligotrophus]